MFDYIAHAVYSAEVKSFCAILYLSVLASLSFGGCIPAYPANPPGIAHVPSGK